MIFSSYIFLFVFLPIVLIIYFGMSKFVSRKVQHIFLVIASLVFYGANNMYYVPIILTSILANYIAANGVQSKERYRKAFFIAGVVFNVAILGYYKYTNFFLGSINDVFDAHYTLRRIILPLGLSFFTFQQIAFLIGIWKKEERVPDFLEYTLFVTFFPHVISGPIVFYQDMIHQYRDEKNRYFNLDNFNQGLFIFMIGLFKKVVIADSLALIANNGVYYQFAELSFGGAWMTSLAYTFQIFFDFAGYSDMAIGAAKMLNINLPVNFYSPYKSKSITEFWKRWHITLGRALAVIVYFPLGGNRKGKARTCFNLFMVFFVSGLWHGAAWKFVVWGMAHGVVRVFEKLFEKPLDKIPNIIRIFFTFIFVSAAWLLFKANSLGETVALWKKMFLPDRISFEGIGRLVNDGILAYTQDVQAAYVITFITILLGMVFLLKKNSIDLYNNFKPNYKNAVAIALLLCVSVIHMSRAGAFIYFNF